MDRELLILGILRGQKMHGYQLADFIDHNLAACTDLKKATAYFLLDKLYAAGWIRYQEDQEGKRPPRRVYQITPSGEEAFQRLLRENLAGYTQTHFPSDIGLGFLDVLPAEEALALLRQRRAVLTEQFHALQAAPQHPGSFHWILEHRAVYLKAELDWLETILQRIEHPSS